MSTASGFEKRLLRVFLMVVFTSANVYFDSESPGRMCSRHREFLFVLHKFMGKIEKYFKRSVPLLISKTARIYRRLHAEEHMGKILYNL